ncbi:MAG: hypothetical protein QM759_08125 [Terricaulis sp.]
MTDRSALEAAASAGVISAEQVTPLFDFLNARAPKPVIAGEEDLRFIRNFHDVFLAIGIILFAVGMGAAMATITASQHDAGAQFSVLGAMSAGAAVVIWLLSEFFARRRRLFLPAIALVCAFTAYCALAAVWVYMSLTIGHAVNPTINGDMPIEARIGMILGASVVLLAPLAFYARFRLPFSLGLAGGGLALLAIAACGVVDWRMTLKYLPAIYLTLGCVLFAAALAFDMRDPNRQTRLSDNGFWLHFAAAPLILNGVFGLIGMGLTKDGAVSSGAPYASMMVGGATANLQAAASLLAIVVLGLISLLINRRALIVSALLTAGIAIGVLLNAMGLGASALAAATLTTLGAFVLILGAGWHSVRRALLGWVKPEGAWARVFPPEGAPL